MVKILVIRGAGIIGAICVGLLSFHPALYAQALVRMEIPSSPNPLGSGARALGMGGAFIAIADDATTASWNPGGLIQLEKPEISAVVGHVDRSEDNDFGNNPEASGAQSIDNHDLNYFSAAYPFVAAGRNMIVSLNYQRLYDFDRRWDFSLDMDDPLIPAPVSYHYEQEGAIYALGFAYSTEMTPRFSVGVTVNYWGNLADSDTWKQNYRQQGELLLGAFPGNFSSAKSETYDLTGWNANLGFLWRMSEHWTLGGVLKTPFTADIDHEVHSVNSVTYPTFPDADTHSSTTRRYDEHLQMPMSYGLGLAYRFSDAFTASADVYRTHWDDLMYENHQGDKTSAISGDPIGSSNIDQTTWFRLAGEYLIIRNYVVPLRAGVFYDPGPAEGSPDSYYGVALGSGIGFKRFSFDVAYQYRFGDSVGSSTLQHRGFSQDVQEHTVYTSLIVYF